VPHRPSLPLLPSLDYPEPWPRSGCLAVSPLRGHSQERTLMPRRHKSRSKDQGKTIKVDRVDPSPRRVTPALPAAIPKVPAKKPKGQK
jgi:hypothetical protein